MSIALSGRGNDDCLYQRGPLVGNHGGGELGDLEVYSVYLFTSDQYRAGPRRLSGEQGFVNSQDFFSLISLRASLKALMPALGDDIIGDQYRAVGESIMLLQNAFENDALPCLPSLRVIFIHIISYHIIIDFCGAGAEMRYPLAQSDSGTGKAQARHRHRYRFRDGDDKAFYSY